MTPGYLSWTGCRGGGLVRSSAGPPRGERDPTHLALRTGSEGSQKFQESQSPTQCEKGPGVRRDSDSLDF